jgi:hypothetical protein
MFSFSPQQPAEGLDDGFLYAVALGQPGKVLKINANTFQIVDRMVLNEGENGAHAVGLTDEYLYVGTIGTDPGVIVQIRLSDFTRVNDTTLPSGFKQVMSLHVFGDYLYVGLQSGQVARLDASTLSFVDYAESPNKIWARDAVQVGEYVYLSSQDGTGGPSYLQKFDISDLSEVATIQLSMKQAHFTLVLDNYLYVASNDVPAGIMKIDLNLFQEVDSVQFSSDKGDADFVVRYGDYLLANGDSFPGRVYRTRLSNFTWVDYLDLSHNKSSGITVSGKYLYISNVLSGSASIIKVDLDTFQEVDKLITDEVAIPQIIASNGDAPPPEPDVVTITGFVTDANTSQPISDASVSIDGFVTVTNQSGGYRVENLTTGLYTVRVTANGYDTNNTVVNATSSGEYTISFQLNRLSVSSTIQGMVTEEGTGNPLVNALVEANTYSTTTNSTGRYFLVVPPAIYNVTASASGYSDARQTVDATTEGTYSANFTLALIDDGPDDETPDPQQDSFPSIEEIGVIVISISVIGAVVWLLLKNR